MDCAWFGAVGALYFGVRGIDLSPKLKQGIESALDNSATVFLAASYMKSDRATLIAVSKYLSLAGWVSLGLFFVASLSHSEVFTIAYMLLFVTSWLSAFAIRWHTNYKEHAVDMLLKLLVFSCLPLLILLFDFSGGFNQTMVLVEATQLLLDSLNIGITLDPVSATFVAILIFGIMNFVVWVISHFFFGLIFIVIVAVVVGISKLGELCIRWSNRWPSDVLMAPTLISPFVC